MNACNIRGYMLVSHSDVVITSHEDVFKFVDGNYIFTMNRDFDTIQNIKIYCGKEHDVYLNGIKCIGTTSYTLFPNTSLPYSEPFFNFLKPNSFLLIKGQNTQEVIKISYDGGILSKNLKEKYTLPTARIYESLYRMGNDCYRFDKNVHEPVKNIIIYTGS